MLRVRVGNPACYFCAVWVPGAVGEWRWRWFDIGQLTDGSGCIVEHPNLRVKGVACKNISFVRLEPLTYRMSSACVGLISAINAAEG